MQNDEAKHVICFGLGTWWTKVMLISAVAIGWLQRWLSQIKQNIPVWLPIQAPQLVRKKKKKKTFDSKSNNLQTNQIPQNPLFYMNLPPPTIFTPRKTTASPCSTHKTQRSPRRPISPSDVQLVRGATTIMRTEGKVPSNVRKVDKFVATFPVRPPLVAVVVSTSDFRGRARATSAAYWRASRRMVYSVGIVE